MTKNDRNITLCFTGHRDYTPSPEAEKRLSDALCTAYEAGYRNFISGMATGFDLAAARAVEDFRKIHPDVYLICAVPFHYQSASYDFEDKIIYDRLLSSADEVHTLSDHYSHGCYFRRDDWMVEHSSRIICWYDSAKKSRKKSAENSTKNGAENITKNISKKSASGGTRYTVKKALTEGIEIVNLFRASDTLF